MEEEALKKNTDCVYFLASPLTCKKGNECEFRHSESARVNPRDCWYWLGGKCLMPDCPFRHPPLDGRPATGAAPSGPVHTGAPGAAKAKTPCFFFSQGYCAKGDKCPFQHSGSTTPAPSGQQAQPAPGPRAPQPAAPVSMETNATKKAEKVTNNGAVVVKMLADTPAAGEARPAPPLIAKEALQLANKKEGRSAGASLQNGTAKGRLEGAPGMTGAVVGASSRLRVRQLQSGDERFQNGLEGEEWWEESSPGFDVLVDVGPDQLRYDEGQFQKGHEAELEHGMSGPASQRRGRQMYQAGEFEEYDGDFMGGYDQSGFGAGGQYNHGGYEGYEQHRPHDPMRHPQGLAFGNRARGDGFERGRERMVSTYEGEEGRAGTDQRWKRPRPDGHPAGKPSRRQRTESGQDGYPSRRMQEEAQKSHELHLRHQLVAQQQGISKSKSSSGRRASDRLSADVGRQSDTSAKEDFSGALADRRASEGEKLKGDMGARLRSGEGERPRHRMDSERRLQAHAAADPMVDDEPPREALPGVRQGEQKKEAPSSFAGPKTLAQILAEKRKAAASEGGDGGSKALVESKKRDTQSDLGTKTQSPIESMSVDHAPNDTASGEERKIKFDKVVGQVLTKPVAFVGPKSLSDILQAKRKADGETSSRDPIRSQIGHKAGDGELHAGKALLTDMEMRSLGNGGLATNNNHHGAAMENMDQSRVATPAALVVVDEAQDMVMPGDDAVDTTMDIEYSERLSGEKMLGSAVDRADDADADAAVDPFDLEIKESLGEPEDDDEFSLDDEDDDFAKKLGGFFS